jgi:hypothetical protein
VHTGIANEIPFPHHTFPPLFAHPHNPASHIPRQQHMSPPTTQFTANGWWFSPCNPVSSTNKTDCHDITEILLKVVLNTINKTKPLICPLYCNMSENEQGQCLVYGNNVIDMTE